MRLSGRLGPWIVGSLFALSAAAGAGSGPTPGHILDSALPQTDPASGSYQVASETAVWYDEARGRSIPIKLYYPADAGERRCPVIVFSHGLGGSREGYAYLGHQWASHGFLSFHPQHHGSDEEVWRGRLRPLKALKSSFEDPSNLVARVADLKFVLDTLEKHAADKTPLGRRIDAERIAVGGHAFGSLAALVLAGQHTAGLEGAAIGPDRRVKAVLAMSSPVLFDGVDYPEAYKDIQIPTLHMTGTDDDSPVGPTRAPHRRIPYDNIQGTDQFLITFSGADHLTFSGHFRDRAAKNDGQFQARIASASTAFLLAYLGDSAELRARLAGGDMERIVGGIGQVEYKEGNRTSVSSTPRASGVPKRL